MNESAVKTVRTMCPMNCHPTLCGMLAEIRDGKLAAVKGDKDNPDSQGFLCIRGQASSEVIENPARLLHPLIRDRRSEEFRRATWDEAFERVLAGMQNPDTVGIWPGHGTFTTNYGTRINAQLLARFANFHGSAFWSPTMICWGLGAFGLGLTGLLETNTKEDMGEHSDLIILWAANLASQPNTTRPEAMNARLSLARAHAVAAFIATRGIDSSRVVRQSRQPAEHCAAFAQSKETRRAHCHHRCAKNRSSGKIR